MEGVAREKFILLNGSFLDLLRQLVFSHFEHHGGNLGSSGCVSYLFARKGVFLIPAQHVEEDKLFEVALEAGADDVNRIGDMFEVLCDPSVFQQVNEALETAEVSITTN